VDIGVLYERCDRVGYDWHLWLMQFANKSTELFLLRVYSDRANH
jgi:hypothetical protein